MQISTRQGCIKRTVKDFSSSHSPGGIQVLVKRSGGPKGPGGYRIPALSFSPGGTGEIPTFYPHLTPLRWPEPAPFRPARGGLNYLCRMQASFHTDEVGFRKK